MFKKKEVIALCLYSMLFGFSTYGFAGIIFPFLKQLLDLSILEVGFLSTIMAIGNAIGMQ